MMEMVPTAGEWYGAWLLHQKMDTAGDHNDATDIARVNRVRNEKTRTKPVVASQSPMG
jgi:hypothetical protein